MLTGENQKSLSSDAENAFLENRAYVQSFLTSNHPFRSGPVCPFVPSAIKAGGILFHHIENQKKERGEEQD